MSSRRHHARSPAVPPLDDDLFCEILLHLPPQPSSLPRASAVCKRWRRLISDPRFFRRFRLRLRHHRNPPLLGFFDRYKGLSFVPTLEAPNRIPPRSISLGCRHGLFLVYLPKPRQVLVWDPITGDKHHIAVPAAFHIEKTVGLVNGAVLRPAGEDQHFQVVLAVADDKQQALACVYSSKTGLWGNLISTPLPYEENVSDFHAPTMVYPDDAVMAGDSLYWKLFGNSFGILEFDLVKQSLAVIQVPVEEKCLTMMRAETGGLGCLLLSDYTAQLWERNTDCDGVASWGLARTIELDKALCLKSEEKGSLFLLGISEENNVAFLWTTIGVFMINLESLKFKKLFKTNMISYYHPFESVYTAGSIMPTKPASSSVALGHLIASTSLASLPLHIFPPRCGGCFLSTPRMGSEVGEMLPSARTLDEVDDNILSEILLRLPPQPSSLPRASAVSKRWHSIACNPGFCRRFRRHHRRNPPLLGFFDPKKFLTFVPTLDAPNRVIPGRLSLLHDDDNCYSCNGSRHGLVFIFDFVEYPNILVWDPVTGDQHRLDFPPEFEDGLEDGAIFHGAVLRDAGDVHFRVVLAGSDTEDGRVLARLYSSETSLWSDLVSIPSPPGFSFLSFQPAVLVGDSLYWHFLGKSSNGILEFNLKRQSLVVIPILVDINQDCFLVIREEGGELGFLSVSDFTAQLWKWKTDCDGVASWVLGRTIELAKLLSVDPAEHEHIQLKGYAEENNMVFLSTAIGFFMVQLQSLKFTFIKNTEYINYYPFESIYTAETRSNGPDEVDLSEQYTGCSK